MALAVRRSAWRFMPAAIGGWLLLVAAVNSGMVYAALHSFPGTAGPNAFDISNHYDRVLTASEREAGLGWMVIAKAVNNRPSLSLSATDGAPLRNATVNAVASRPVGPEQRTALHLSPAADGVFASAETLAPGRWDLSITVTQSQHRLHTTKRLLIQ